MRRLAGPALALAAACLVTCGRNSNDTGAPDDAGGAVDTAATASLEGAEGGAAVPVSGEAVYAANCATCHGADGAGDGPAAIGLEPPPADLTDHQWVTGDGSLGAIENTIQNGSPGTAMIGWRGTLSDAQIAAVARYVQSFSGGGQ